MTDGPVVEDNKIFYGWFLQSEYDNSPYLFGLFSTPQEIFDHPRAKGLRWKPDGDGYYAGGGFRSFEHLGFEEDIVAMTISPIRLGELRDG